MGKKRKKGERVVVKRVKVVKHREYKDMLKSLKIYVRWYMVKIKDAKYKKIEYKKILFWKNEMQVKYAGSAVMHKFDMFCGSKKAL